MYATSWSVDARESCLEITVVGAERDAEEDEVVEDGEEVESPARDVAGDDPLLGGEVRGVDVS